MKRIAFSVLTSKTSIIFQYSNIMDGEEWLVNGQAQAELSGQRTRLDMPCWSWLLIRVEIWDQFSLVAIFSSTAVLKFSAQIIDSLLRPFIVHALITQHWDFDLRTEKRKLNFFSAHMSSSILCLTSAMDPGRYSFFLWALFIIGTKIPLVKPDCRPDDWFRCNDGVCIAKVWKCDGKKDCLD